MSKPQRLLNSIITQANEAAKKFENQHDYSQSILEFTSALQKCKQLIGAAGLCCSEHEDIHERVRLDEEMFSTRHIQTEASQVAAAITFNLAVVHHAVAQGLDTGSSDFVFRKAANLYHLAFEILIDQEDDSCLLFVLATANNLGLIYTRLDNKIWADKCFEFVWSTLSYCWANPFCDMSFVEFLQNFPSFIGSANAPAA